MRLLTRLKDIGKDSFVYGLSQVLSQLIGFLLLPVYTSYLTPEDYGVLAMLSLIPILLPAFVNLGLNNAVFRFYSKCQSETEKLRLIGTSHLLVFFFSSLIVMVLLLFSSPLCLWLTDSAENLKAFNLMVLSAWFTSISTIPLVVLKQRRRVKQIAIRSLMGLLVNVLTTVFFVVYLQWGVLGSVIGNATGSAVAAILVILAVSLQTWRSFEKKSVRSLLRYSMPFVPYFIQAVVMGIIGQYIVKEHIGLEEAGFYSIAWRFALPLVLVLNAFNNSWAAFKFEIRYNDPDPKKSYRDIFSFYIVLVSLSWMLLSLWMPVILKMVINKQYHQAANLIPLLALIPVVQGVRGMLTTGLEMSESPKWMPIITLLGLISLMVSSYFLVPILGIYGAAFSVVFGWFTTAVVTYLYSQRTYLIDYNLLLLIGIIAFSIVIFWFPLDKQINISVLLAIILKSFIALAGFACLYFIMDRKKYAKRFFSKFSR